MAITIYTLFQSTWIVLGLWVDCKLLWMVIYECLEKDAGMKYMNGTLEKKWNEYLRDKWHDYLLKK
jgi:hypothetical protein